MYQQRSLNFMTKKTCLQDAIFATYSRKSFSQAFISHLPTCSRGCMQLRHAGPYSVSNLCKGKIASLMTHAKDNRGNAIEQICAVKSLLLSDYIPEHTSTVDHLFLLNGIKIAISSDMKNLVAKQNGKIIATLKLHHDLANSPFSYRKEIKEFFQKFVIPSGKTDIFIALKNGVVLKISVKSSRATIVNTGMRLVFLGSTEYNTEKECLAFIKKRQSYYQSARNGDIGRPLMGNGKHILSYGMALSYGKTDWLPINEPFKGAGEYFKDHFMMRKSLLTTSDIFPNLSDHLWEYMVKKNPRTGFIDTNDQPDFCLIAESDGTVESFFHFDDRAAFDSRITINSAPETPSCGKGDAEFQARRIPNGRWVELISFPWQMRLIK